MVKYLEGLVCVGVVPDGNRRGGEKLGLKVFAAHRRGASVARAHIKELFKMGVRHVVFLAATRANLEKRDPQEISNLYSLFKAELRRRLRSPKQGVRVYIRGSWDQVRPDAELTRLIHEIELFTKEEADHELTFLFGHNGEDDYQEAIRRKEVRLSTNPLSVRTFLPTAHLPYIDLIIRTGAEEEDAEASRAEGGSHWTNWSDSMFLPHLGHAQICSTRTLWPDLTKDQLHAIVGRFLARERRKGK